DPLVPAVAVDAALSHVAVGRGVAGVTLVLQGTMVLGAVIVREAFHAAAFTELAVRQGRAASGARSALHADGGGDRADGPVGTGAVAVLPASRCAGMRRGCTDLSRRALRAHRALDAPAVVRVAVRRGRSALRRRLARAT